MAFRVSTKITGRFSAARMTEAQRRVERAIPDALTRIARDAEKLLKRDYLQRGGTFTRTKNKGTPTGRRGEGFGRRAKTRTTGYQWVKNPGDWLRVGTGNLRRSWIHVSAVKVGKVWQSRIVTRGVPYARIHEFGGWAGPGKKVWIPKRSYLQPMMDDHMPKWRGWPGDDVRAAFR